MCERGKLCPASVSAKYYLLLLCSLESSGLDSYFLCVEHSLPTDLSCCPSQFLPTVRTQSRSHFFTAQRPTVNE